MIKKSGLVLVVVAILILGAVYWNNKVDIPGDFNFVYTYGINGQEQVDTYSKTVVYDSVEGKIEIPISMTDEEIRTIYRLMKSNEVMSLPESFSVINQDMNPCEVCNLRVAFNGESNSISWSTRNFDLVIDPGKEKDIDLSLRHADVIGNLIEEVVEQHLREMDLPEKKMYL